MIPCGLFCVPVLAPVCNPMIAAKSIDSLHIADRKLKAKDKDALHPDDKKGILGGLAGSLFGGMNLSSNDGQEEDDIALDLELKLKAQEIATWSDWSYPLCDPEGKGTH